MSAEPVFEIVIESTRNLSRVRFAGAFTGAAMQMAAAKVAASLPQLKPGFATLADFSAVASMDLDCVRPLTQIMDACRVAGVGLIVRILPEPNRDIGINLLAIVHYRGKVKTVTVDTLAEAERALN